MVSTATLSTSGCGTPTCLFFAEARVSFAVFIYSAGSPHCYTSTHSLSAETPSGYNPVPLLRCMRPAKGAESGLRRETSACAVGACGPARGSDPSQRTDAAFRPPIPPSARVRTCCVFRVACSVCVLGLCLGSCTCTVCLFALFLFVLFSFSFVFVSLFASFFLLVNFSAANTWRGNIGCVGKRNNSWPRNGLRCRRRRKRRRGRESCSPGSNGNSKTNRYPPLPPNLDLDVDGGVVGFARPGSVSRTPLVAMATLD